MTDGRIAVRKYRQGDEFGLYEAICESSAELTRWGFYHPSFTLEDAVEDVAGRIRSWDNGESFTFLIEAPTPTGQDFLGNCRIEEYEPELNQAALGWWVRTSQTGKGVATAAARLVARAAFEDLHVDLLHVYMRAENRASRRVAEKIGARLEQIKLEPDGIYCAVYALKPGDLQVTSQ